MNGYCGKMLFVNLTDGSFEERELSEKMARDYIGGYGVGARILYDEMKPGVDALGPESMLGFTTSPLNGTPAFISGRYTVVHKSPVTGGWNDANSGGYFGGELKKAGFDHVFVKGIASKPVYLWINDGKYEIRDASALWGKNVVETEEALQEELGDKKIRVASIGPAGEQLSLISAIMNDEHRAAARGGCGAVMGSKNLKAVVARGTADIPVADKDALKAANKGITEDMKGPGPAKPFSQFGTSMMTEGGALSGDSPVKNWGGAAPADFTQEQAHELNGEVTDPKYRVKKYACERCPLGCGAIYDTSTSTYPGGMAGRPEYETGAQYGCNMLNDDGDVLIKCNDICNLYGLDTISAGGTVAWAIECYENGLLTKEETGGLEMTWGNGPSIVAATQQMADGSTEFGKLLALGSEFAAKKLGKGKEYLVNVNGIELPMHDPRFGPGFARSYRIDPTPARHVKGGRGIATMQSPIEVKYNYDNVGDEDRIMTAEQEVLNAAGFCIFKDMTGTQNISLKLVPPVTGWTDFDEAEQEQTGMRIFHLRHAFSLREGLTPEDSVLPPRCVGEPALDHGPLKGITIDHKKLNDEWFKAVDWDPETWRPSRAMMEKLGLKKEADDLKL